MVARDHCLLTGHSPVKDGWVSLLASDLWDSYKKKSTVLYYLLPKARTQSSIEEWWYLLGHSGSRSQSVECCFPTARRQIRMIMNYCPHQSASQWASQQKKFAGWGRQAGEQRSSPSLAPLIPVDRVSYLRSSNRISIRLETWTEITLRQTAM